MEKKEDEKQTLSKNAQKKLLKQKQKEEKKIQQQTQGDTQKVDEEENAEEYYKNRVRAIQKLKQNTKYFPYPHKFQTTHTIAELVSKYNPLITENGKFLEEEVSVAGRLHSKRKQGKQLIFLDIIADAVKIQIMGNKKLYGDDQAFDEVNEILKRGDIVGAKGKIGRSQTGELSIAPTFLQLLSPCLHVLPKTNKDITEVLTNQETRYRQRYLDLICNQKPREKFITRSKIIAMLRKELTARDFLEVETPTLNIIAGGATARPFKTFHNELNLDMFLRVAPELYLKTCVVGGLNRVFEIGKNFRNEGIDLTHNPEFTALELYWAFADYQDLMKFTEEILCKIVFEIKGSHKFTITNDQGEEITIDFSPPWKKLSVIEELEKVTKKKFPEEFESEDARKFFDDLLKELNIPCSNPRTSTRMIDKMIGELLENSCINPTFLIEQPQIMCPLAKYHRSKKNLTERFELFINKKEYVNAYTELNDPFVQLEEFKKQAENKKKGDLEANDVDEDFVKCLEHALPPTAGWGLGIDRFIMLLTNSTNIQEVILFPAMRPIKQQAELDLLQLQQEQQKQENENKEKQTKE